MRSVALLMPASSPSVISRSSTLYFRRSPQRRIHRAAAWRPNPGSPFRRRRNVLRHMCRCCPPRPTDRLDLPARGLGLDFANMVFAFLHGPCVALGLAEFDQGDGILDILLETLDRGDLVLQRRTLAHDLLRGFGDRSRGRDLRRRNSVQRGRRWALSQSKMPPQQSDGLLGFVYEVLDFGAHGFQRGVNWRRVSSEW